jgi:GcrA cell cycle regulator
MLDWKTASIEEKLSVIRPLAEQGASAGEMSKHFSNATRNATLSFCIRRKIRLGGSAASGGRAVSVSKPHGNKGQPKANAIAAKRKVANENGGLAFKLAQARKDGLSVEEGMAAVLGQPRVEGLGDAVPGDRKLISLLELNERTCRWPFGDPRESSFGFCGCRKGRFAGPYCPEHTAKAENRR